MSLMEVPGRKIETEPDAIQFLEELIGEMVRLKSACTVPYVPKDEETQKALQRMRWAFLQKQGQVMGAVRALFLVRMISERTFFEVTQKAINCLSSHG